jgi:polyisoprenoid-binding protein YceI
MTTTQLPAQLTSGTYTVDPSHSRIGFVARHAMVTKVRGSFNEFDATAEIDAEDITRSSAQVTINVDSIDTRNEQRDGHLRSNDFLDIAHHPQITFVTTGVTRVSDDVVRVAGDLTIKGESRPVTVDFTFEGAATDPFGNQRVGFEGELVVNRKDWGLTWNAALETGGVLVSEKVKLDFDLSAIKAA